MGGGEQPYVYKWRSTIYRGGGQLFFNKKLFLFMAFLVFFVIKNKIFFFLKNVCPLCHIYGCPPYIWLPLPLPRQQRSTGGGGKISATRFNAHFRRIPFAYLRLMPISAVFYLKAENFFIAFPPPPLLFDLPPLMDKYRFFVTYCRATRINVCLGHALTELIVSETMHASALAYSTKNFSKNQISTK